MPAAGRLFLFVTVFFFTAKGAFGKEQTGLRKYFHEGIRDRICAAALFKNLCLMGTLC
jgi:hypothetical protein